jgi:UDP-N-acetylmuramoyl-L-alanyl-D-glutamate--2,6-diaminopimelate ligase
VKLDELSNGLHGVRVKGDSAVEISELTYDSRKVTPGALFFALPGQHADGRQFAGEALTRGASALVVPEGSSLPGGAAIVEAPDVRRTMAQMAARFFGDPSRELVLFGVTGTNGKTTFTYLMESILRQAGFRPGVIGTISYRYGERTFRPANTTPESVDLQRILREMVRSGMTHALLEVSSHGLDFHRVEACHFSCAAFTMLGRDHLDHHRSMEAYFASKSTLFTQILARSAIRDRIAVLNRDDPYGQRLLGLSPVPVISVGRGEEAEYRLESAVCDREGTSVKIRTPRGTLRLHSPLLAQVNAMNILMAVAVSMWHGLEAGPIARGVEAVQRIPGRLERIANDRGFLVLVDYAHTPDALDRMLSSVHDLSPGRLITVFGCGGDRDRGKRPLMGQAAAQWSDLILVTSDNPRSERPEAIIEEVVQGIREEGIAFRDPTEIAGSPAGTRVFSSVVDRREAIGLAIRIARPGDTVVVAGKGHEEFQILGGQRVPFRDEEEVVRALRGIGNRESAVG